MALPGRNRRKKRATPETLRPWIQGQVVMHTEEQHDPTAQSGVVPHDCPMSAVPLHVPLAQLFEAQSVDVLQAPPLGAPEEETHRPAAHRPE
jgi:hypothetical protein